jgi:hypothetical protein
MGARLQYYFDETPKRAYYYTTNAVPSEAWLYRNPVGGYASFGNETAYGAFSLDPANQWHESVYGHGLVRVNYQFGVNFYEKIVDLTRHGINASIGIEIGQVTTNEVRYEIAETTTWGGLTTAYVGLSPARDWNTPGSQSQGGDFVEGVHYQVLTQEQTRAQEYGGGMVTVKYLANMSGTPINFTGNSIGLNYYTTGSFYLIKKGDLVPVQTGEEVRSFLRITETNSPDICNFGTSDPGAHLAANATFTFYKSGQNPCPPGETYDVDCGECICTNICDGTLAGIVNSIVL